MRHRLLDGLTRPGRHRAVTADELNPKRHHPLALQNRIRMQVVGPDECGNQVTKHDAVAHGNIMATYGLSRIVSLLAGGAMDASNWIGGMAIGTNSATAEASNNTGLYNSTWINDVTDAADMIEAGARTLRCVATFASSQPAGAAEIREIGLFQISNNATTSLVARRVLTGAESVNKGASDSINVSYDVIFTTA